MICSVYYARVKLLISTHECHYQENPGTIMMQHVQGEFESRHLIQLFLNIFYLVPGFCRISFHPIVSTSLTTEPYTKGWTLMRISLLCMI